MQMFSIAILSMRDTAVVVRSALGTQSTGPVTLVSNTGGRIVDASFSFIAVPTLLAASPSSGQHANRIDLLANLEPTANIDIKHRAA